jgi:hypothetical protein
MSSMGTQLLCWKYEVTLKFCTYISSFRVTAQRDCRQSFTAEMQVRSQTSLCGICRGKNDTGTVYFSEYFCFPLSVSVHTYLIHLQPTLHNLSTWQHPPIQDTCSRIEHHVLLLPLDRILTIYNLSMSFVSSTNLKKLCGRNLNGEKINKHISLESCCSWSVLFQLSSSISTSSFRNEISATEYST